MSDALFRAVDLKAEYLRLFTSVTAIEEAKRAPDCGRSCARVLAMIYISMAAPFLLILGAIGILLGTNFHMIFGVGFCAAVVLACVFVPNKSYKLITVRKKGECECGCGYVSTHDHQVEAWHILADSRRRYYLFLTSLANLLEELVPNLTLLDEASERLSKMKEVAARIRQLMADANDAEKDGMTLGLYEFRSWSMWARNLLKILSLLPIVWTLKRERWRFAVSL